MLNVIRFFVKIVFFILFRITISGIDNIPKNGAAVLCSNHTGELDMFVIGYRTNRLVRWMAKEELFKNPVVSFLFKWLGAFPVKRGKADFEAIKTALQLLEEGHIVGIFPQGTRIRNKNVSKVKAKGGAALLAVKAGVPIIPVAIEGKYRLFNKVKVTFGKPFYVNESDEQKLSKEQLNEISERIMDEIYNLMEDK